MALTQSTDIVRRAILRLPPPYWGKPRIASCLRAILEEVQELENALWTVMLMRTVDVATGIQLHTIGKLVGEGYLGQDEETYRILVRARIRINISRGTIGDIIAVMRYGYTGDIEWVSNPSGQPARLQVTLDQAQDLPVDVSATLLGQTRAAGVLIEYLQDVDAAAGLRWDDTSDTIDGADAGGGWADASGTVTSLGAPSFTAGTA
jgi:hypothetical protein